MQFYLDGYQPGDPATSPSDIRQAGESTDEVDVLIVGSGPAGLVLAAQLAMFPGITTRLIERQGGPLERGQADGIACRTVEMFEAFGFSEKVLKEAYWVNKTAFWGPNPDDPSRIVRTARIDDTPEGTSEFPHVIMNQARVHDYLLDVMRRSPSRLEPDYGIEFIDLRVEDPLPHPVVVKVKDLGTPEGATERTIRARYVVGCDGARSAVRQSIGRRLEGDAANQAWGVLDVLAVTDFPDIRFKAAIQSANGGNILVIPREGGYLVRLYIELDELQPGERVSEKGIDPDLLIATANRILHPYTIEVKEVAWWSVYEVGQRITDRYDDASGDPGSPAPRVFIAGDACHTHSAKAGQGMNVSMQDSFNLGWKLAAVLSGRSDPALLLTYSAERQVIAQKLIEFDKNWAKMFSAAPSTAEQQADESVDPRDFVRRFRAQLPFTAGVATRYEQSAITARSDHQDLATGFTVGMRFHSAPVTRLADAKQVQLGHAARADGRWRIYAFSDEADPRDSNSAIAALCRFLENDTDSPIRRATPIGANVDDVIDVRAILPKSHPDLDVVGLPSLLVPRKGRYGLIDYEKTFIADPAADVFRMRGIDRERGCVIVVRPDQYVAHVLPLDAHKALADFFTAVLLPAGRTEAFSI